MKLTQIVSNLSLLLSLRIRWKGALQFIATVNPNLVIARPPPKKKKALPVSVALAPQTHSLCNLIDLCRHLQSMFFGLMGIERSRLGCDKNIPASKQNRATSLCDWIFLPSMIASDRPWKMSKPNQVTNTRGCQYIAYAVVLPECYFESVSPPRCP